MGASVRQSSHLAGGNGSVPLHHLLWLQNHFLVNELSWTLHESLENPKKLNKNQLPAAM